MFYKTNSNTIVWEAIYSELLHKTDNNYIISHNLIQYGFNIPQIYYNNGHHVEPGLGYVGSWDEHINAIALDYRLKNQPIHIIFDTTWGPYKIHHTKSIQDKPY